MKRLFIVLCFLSGVVACQNGNDRKIEFNNCLARRCDNSVYQKFSAQGFTPYDMSGFGGMSYLQALSSSGGYSYSSWGQFCGCPSGSTPTYHPLVGLGCVQNYALQQAGYATVFWALMPGQHHLTQVDSAQVASYIQNPYGTGFGSCVNFLAETCFVNQPDACQNGNVCRPSDLQSGLGFCTRQ